MVTIEGYAKGFSYAPGDRFDRTNHDWNAVRIDGEWRLLDATWSAGHVSADYRFERDFDDFYFFTPPEQFIHTHFPKDPAWQLLKNGITLADFEALVYLRPAFFRNGLTAMSHTQSVIQADGETAITFRAPPGVSLSTKLERDGRNYRSHTFCQRDKENVYVYLRPPDPGRYELDVSAGGEWAVNHAIQAGAGMGSEAEYPEQFLGFTEHRCFLYAPMQRHLRAGTKQVFKLRVPDAQKAAVIMGDDWHQLTKSGDLFEGEIMVKQGEVGVYAQFPGESKYNGLLRYTGH
ncbi:MAG: hypothetical protein ACM3ZC_02470 [Bacteroidota bacterium]